MGNQSGWRPDPSGRNQERYFDLDGSATHLVRNDGVESTEGSSPSGLSVTASHGDIQPLDQGVIAKREQNVSSEAGPILISRRRYLGNEPVVFQAQIGAEGRAISVAPTPTIVHQRRSPWLIAAMCALTVLLGAAITYAVQEHSAANRWMSEDHAEVLTHGVLTTTLYLTDLQVKSLHNQVSSLHSQLSALANQNERALYQNPALAPALQDAQTVAFELNNCVNETQVLLSDISAGLGSHGLVPSTSYSDALTANHVCQSAQADDATLQQALSGG